MTATASIFPRVSVVVPVRNRSDLLERCIGSLRDQDFPSQEYEILVCDDGSSEDLSKVLAKFEGRCAKIRLLRQPPIGPAAARNLGIRATQSPIVVFLDSDVVADRGFVRHILLGLVRNPDWKGAEAALIPIEGEEGPLWDGPFSGDGGRYHTAAIAYRREALITAGGLDESFKMPACEDVELAVRVLSQGAIGYVPEAKVYHPRRRVLLTTHWRWRMHWKYSVILAKRYGLLAFPGQDAGSFPRLRLALAAVVTLPAGRLIQGLKHMRRRISEGAIACAYALFDVFCGICALPEILFTPIPERRNYLK